MSGITLRELVREQILAEAGEIDRSYVDDFIDVSDYINEQLNAMTSVELLERISSALDCLMPEIAYERRTQDRPRHRSRRHGSADSDRATFSTLGAKNMAIIRNSARCNTCDVELVSYHVHDFKVHTCPNKFVPLRHWVGEKLVEVAPPEATFNWGVDGGKEYVRRLGEGFTDTSIFTED